MRMLEGINCPGLATFFVLLLASGNAAPADPDSPELEQDAGPLVVASPDQASVDKAPGDNGALTATTDPNEPSPAVTAAGADPNEPSPAVAADDSQPPAAMPPTTSTDPVAIGEEQPTGSVEASPVPANADAATDGEDPVESGSSAAADATAATPAQSESVDGEESESTETLDAEATRQDSASMPIEIEQTDPAPAAVQPAKEMSLEDVIALVQQQQAQLLSQRKQLEEQSKQISSLSEELDALRAPPPALMSDRDSGADKPDEAAPQPERVIAQTADSEEPEQAAADSKEKTRSEVATAQQDDPSRAIMDDFPGAWRLPGTQAALAIGGYVKAAAVINQDPLEIKDRFIVGSIPVGDQDDGNKSESSLSAQQSRLNFDLREPTDVGIMRAFVEGDFAETGETFRLRHAFGQWDRMLAGKTWSAFVDTSASPEEVDFEGLNGRINVRQAQVRFSPPIGEDFSLVVSLEDPNPQIQNGSGVTRVPDIVVAGQFEPHDRLHMKLGMLSRQLRAKTLGRNSVLKKEYAWGLTMSGSFSVPRLDERDAILFQLSGGDAIGRYVNDLNSVGDYDAIFDDDNKLNTFDIIAGYVSLQHWWGEVTRSNFTLGWVDVDNPDFIEGDAYKRTIRTSANLIWTPTPRVDIGWELLWGERENENGDSGDALQTQFMARYRFSQ